MLVGRHQPHDLGHSIRGILCGIMTLQGRSDSWVVKEDAFVIVGSLVEEVKEVLADLEGFESVIRCRHGVRGRLAKEETVSFVETDPACLDAFLVGFVVWFCFVGFVVWFYFVGF